MPLYQSKRKFVEAVQFVPERWKEISDFVGYDAALSVNAIQVIGNWHGEPPVCVSIRSEGRDVYKSVLPGGFLVRLDDVTYTAMSEDEFNENYERIDAAPDWREDDAE